MRQIAPDLLGLPDLVTGKGQNRGHKPGHAGQNRIQRGLCRPAGQGIHPVAVQPVLDNVQIEVGHIHYAEIIDRTVDNVEIKTVIGLVHLFN